MNSRSKKLLLRKFFQIQKKFIHSGSSSTSPLNLVGLLQNLRNLDPKNKEDWGKHEDHIIQNIHFFDADQITDIIYLYGKHDLASFHLWELLGRKLFDYDFDQFQAEALMIGLMGSKKTDEYVFTHIFRQVFKTQLNLSPEQRAFRSKLNPL